MEDKEILYEHYEETCKICRSNEKERNRYFVIVCVFVGLLFLFMVEGANIAEVIHGVINKKYECDINLSVGTIQSLTWVLLFYFTVRYFQLCIYIERLYQYIHEIEIKMSQEMNCKIQREGIAYLKDYPRLLDYIWVVYSVVFPILYLAIIIYKIIMEIQLYDFDWNLGLHIVLSICIIMLLFSYLTFCHRTWIRKIFDNREKTGEYKDN